MFAKKRISMLSIIFILLPIGIALHLNQAQSEHSMHLNIHFYYVMFSSLIALIVGFASYQEYKKNGVEKIFYLSLGFIGVSVFYSYHALITPNLTILQLFNFPTPLSNISAFVLFGDLSRLWLAIMLFVPDDLFANNHEVKRYFNGYTLIAFFVLLTAACYMSLLYPQVLPMFKHADLTDTYFAILTKVATLLFLGISTLKYYYSFKAKQNYTILTLIVGLILIMETAIIFMVSKPWSSNWWLAHNLFLLGYVVIGAGVLISYFDKEKYEYFDVLGQIHRYTKLLEEKNVELSHMANFDSLTGLSNRNHFIRVTKEYISSSLIMDVNFALMFIDLDYFKSINDLYGHQIGDELLKVVAKRISSLIKSNDLASRIGGDEFLILLKDVNRSQSEDISKRFLKKLAEPIVIEGISCHIGLSIGVSVFPESGRTIDELISKSDEAMYQMKNESRRTQEVLSQ